MLFNNSMNTVVGKSSPTTIKKTINNPHFNQSIVYFSYRLSSHSARYFKYFRSSVCLFYSSEAKYRSSVA